MSEIVIRLPGLLTTVQDAGRFGYQDRGLPPAGALDLDSLGLANLLAGNARGEGCLECTLVGPELEFTGETVFALAGAPMDPRLNGQALPQYETLRAKAGDILSLGTAEAGARTYISFRGGFALPSVLGSLSTYVRAGVGGFEGRPLRKGDRIPLRGSAEAASIETASPAMSLRSIPASFRPAFPATIELRALVSHEADRFEDDTLDCFFSASWKVSQHSDRMGCRLEGPVLAHRRGADIISEGVQTGTIQVPGDGQPIVLLADRQTTGGYTRIAHVIKVDLPRLGQARAGNIVRFRRTTLDEARGLLLEREARWDRLVRESTRTPAGSGHPDSPERRFRIEVGGRTYDVGLTELPD